MPSYTTEAPLIRKYMESLVDASKSPPVPFRGTDAAVHDRADHFGAIRPVDANQKVTSGKFLTFAADYYPSAVHKYGRMAVGGVAHWAATMELTIQFRARPSEDGRYIRQGRILVWF